MQIPLVMTIIGKDRTGLVESVASLVAEHGGNWLESRMCRLGGEFAGILRIHVPAEKQAALMAALNGLQKHGLSVVVSAGEAGTVTGNGQFTTLEIVGHDRPGIVREIARALAGQKVNVEELSSELVSAPMSGETLFKAQARLQLPEHCDMAALRAELEKIAADLMVDISFADLATNK
ncbi:MAG: amino acid-binding domain protein [Pedosphaera sp.]|nr:amino acid-binding domain protein [Pedosphaera sp.]